ncbi:MAG TPA: DNA lyase [Chloroflexi bacterium]|nr:DNA lyase [Chloroflexota bacterium]HAL28959.1 DNA lyase [Chloroflexota bacterium]
MDEVFRLGFGAGHPQSRPVQRVEEGERLALEGIGRHAFTLGERSARSGAFRETLRGVPATLRARLRQVARRLRRAYGAPPAPRRLPPLDELVLTILSQNTNDTNRDRAYADLRAKLPLWDDVADAPLPVIERAIRSGGLAPTKAPRIRAVLRALRERGIRLDDRALRRIRHDRLFDLLVGLPGVGPKTAACVLLFSLDRPYFPVDTHVHRVANRLGLVPPKATAVRTQEQLQAALAADEMYEVHMNLIRHGRHVCVALRPICSQCVLNDLCPRIGVVRSR